MSIQAYRFRGNASMAPVSSGTTFENRPFSDLGNVSEISISFEEETTDLADYRSPGGGLDASMKRISNFSGTIVMRHFTADNLSRVLWGTSTAQSATPVVDEAGYKIVPGKRLCTKAMINTTVAPVLKKGATTILTADYTVSKGGIKFSDTITTGGVASGDAITISYTPQASARIDALMSAAPDVSIFFDGINEPDSKGVVLKLWKCKLGAAQDVSLIGDDYGSLSVSFTVQRDDTVVAAGFSKYGLLEIED